MKKNLDIANTFCQSLGPSLNRGSTGNTDEKIMLVIGQHKQERDTAGNEK